MLCASVNHLLVFTKLIMLHGGVACGTEITLMVSACIRRLHELAYSTGHNARDRVISHALHGSSP